MGKKSGGLFRSQRNKRFVERASLVIFSFRRFEFYFPAGQTMDRLLSIFNGGGACRLRGLVYFEMGGCQRPARRGVGQRSVRSLWPLQQRDQRLFAARKRRRQ